MEYFVRGTNGNDANDGMSYANAFKTPAAAYLVWMPGDTVTFSEILEDGEAVVDTIDNLTLRQHPNIALDRFKWRGATAISGGAWTLTGTPGVYEATVSTTAATGEVAAVLVDYFNSVHAGGGHFGALVRVASAADVLAASGSGSHVFFFDAAGPDKITAYSNGVDLSTRTTHYVARHNQIFIDLTGTGNVVDGLYFEAGHNDAQGSFVWLKDGTVSSLVIRCKFWDGSYHACVVSGQTAAISNATISTCSSYGLANDGAHFTAFQQNGFGNAGAIRFTNCHVVRHTWLTPAAVQTEACAQSGWYSHASAGTPIRDVLHSGCTSYDYFPTVVPICTIGGCPAPADAQSWADYAGRAINCSFSNMTNYRNGDGYFAFRTTTLEFGQAGSSNLNTYGGLGIICASFSGGGGKLLFEACPIIFNMGGATAGSSQVGAVAFYNNSNLYFVNCSIAEVSTDVPSPASQYHLGIFLGGSTTAAMQFVGCVLSHRVAKGGGCEQRAFYSDSSTALTLNDNAWGLMPNGVAHSVGGITGANPGSLSPGSCADANAQDLDAWPFVSATNLRIDPGSAAYGVLRATSSIVPARQINGPYDGTRGAYAKRDESTGQKSMVVNMLVDMI